MRNNSSIINVHKKNSSKSDVVTQLLYGDTFKKIKKTGIWIKIKNEIDNYKGYIKYKKFPNNSVDLTLCIDVLEHIPEEDIDWFLEKFLSITKKFSFISVACYPAIATLPNGENAHITIHTPEWWLNKLSKFYKINPLLKIICLCILGSNEDKKPYHELAINDNLQNYS